MRPDPREHRRGEGILAGAILELLKTPCHHIESRPGGTNDGENFVGDCPGRSSHFANGSSVKPTFDSSSLKSVPGPNSDLPPFFSGNDRRVASLFRHNLFAQEKTT
jgi:hypothetical protein